MPVRPASYVAFTVGGVRYAVAIAHVKEVMRPLPVSGVARSPSAVTGVADYRGEIAVVMDLRQHFGVAPRDAGARGHWIVLHLAALTLALAVDDVVGVIPASAEHVRQMPEGASGVFVRDVVAALPHEGELIFLLDLERFHDLGERVHAIARGEA